MIDELMNCKCGATPEIYTRFPVAKQMYQGEIYCPKCGEQVLGKQWHWDAEHAVDEAIEEWNMQMKTKKQLEAELDEKIQKGDITIEEAEMEWQDYMHRGEDRREW